MKKFILIISIFLLTTISLLANGTQEMSFSPNSYHNAVSSGIGHSLNKNETAIADCTYLYYNQKCKSDWDKETFDYAVKKGIANCQNKAMLAAAKAGSFGEKLLKALIVSAGDAAEATSNWLNTNSSRYDKEVNQ